MFFALTPLFGLAQQDPLYALYQMNPVLINAAWAGANADVNVNVGYRTQWVGLEGQPETIYFSANGSLLDNRAGTGLVVVSDRIGNIANQEASLLFTYNLLFDGVTFSFGMQAGVQTFDTNDGALNILDPGDNAFGTAERGTRMNIGAGALLKSDRFFVGISAPRLMPSTFENGGQSFQLYKQHLYVSGGYVHYFNEHVRFKPMVVLRGVQGAPVSMDISANVNLNGIHTAGVFTRNFSSYGLIVQTTIKEQFRFGYVFEMPTNRSVGTAFNSHEVMLGMRLSLFSFHERTINPF